MLIAFNCLKLSETTVENQSHVPVEGETIEQLARWPGKRFVVAAVDTARRPNPYVMVREISVPTPEG